MLEQTGKLPDHIIAAVGGGSNAMGMFYPFIEDKDVKLYGVEAGGLGIDSQGNMQRHYRTGRLEFYTVR